MGLRVGTAVIDSDSVSDGGGGVAGMTRGGKVNSTCCRVHKNSVMMMILLLFLQKQNLASAIYLFGLRVEAHVITFSP
jgi:hypothetical protein